MEQTLAERVAELQEYVAGLHRRLDAIDQRLWGVEERTRPGALEERVARAEQAANTAIHAAYPQGYGR